MLWLVFLKKSTERRIIVVIGHRMFVDDLPFGLVWCEWAHSRFCPQSSHPPDTRAKGRVSGVWRPPVPTKSLVLDIGFTPEFCRKSQVSGVGCPSGARPCSQQSQRRHDVMKSFLFFFILLLFRPMSVHRRHSNFYWHFLYIGINTKVVACWLVVELLTIQLKEPINDRMPSIINNLANYAWTFAL
jgi:hypothetical protein